MEENNLQVLKFDAVLIPTPYESLEKRDDKYVYYGTSNLYPNYLLNLYNWSPIHSSIINSKSNYIIGNGLQTSDGIQIDVRVNPGDKVDEFINKIVKDYLIFNYFAVEVVYNVFKKPIEFHFVPAWKIRTNNSKTKFWVSDDWGGGSRPIIYDRYRPQSQDSISKIFFFDGYNPSLNRVYSTPEYSGAIKSIQNDIEIRDFNLNNIRNHFSASTIITFFRGSNVSEEVKRTVLKDLKDSYTGSAGKKLVIDFQDPSQPSADVKSIGANDWDKAYQQVAMAVQNDIFIGHQVTSPTLFGVKTPGQLGGSTEIETAYEIFKDTYIENKRNELSEALNILFQEFDLIPDGVEFQDKQLFSARISELLKEKIYTINELRKEAGLPPYKDGDKLLAEIPSAATTSTTTTPSIPVAQHQHFDEEVQLDFEKVAHLGTVSKQFKIIKDGKIINSQDEFRQVEMEFDTQDEIRNYLLENAETIHGMSINKIKAAIRKETGINTTKADLQNIFQELTDSGILNIDTSDSKNIQVTPATEPNRPVETMYSYVVRPGYGTDIIATTRPFCRRMIENNRLYTREELQTIGEIFNRDVFNLGGGFYTNSSGETTPHCRHTFQQRIVVRR